MTGFDSMRRIALDRLDDDDIQVYAQPSIKRPIESDYASQVAYTRALEMFCDTLPHTKYRAVKTYNGGKPVYVSQPEQEPVSWMVYTQDGQSVYVTDNPTDIQEGQRALPLYTTPPQRPWEGLTGKDIIEMWPQTSTVGWDDIRLIEAKLKQKNGYNEEKNT